MKLIAATGNKHKLIEFETITKDFGFELLPKSAVGLGGFDPEEPGETFAENSLLKAKAICERCGLPCIADDSGIVVDALGGAPGVHSARYAGEHGDDAANRVKLLSELGDTPFEDRTGRFYSVITIVWP
ncbi:MAG: non-canonical purine NTP pyrophosphatase, RdgB/HAM1 family, partial [Firmicutes bacterium]|nr:non-canonical purine NTP pyrophosphatase, RdgB/HAM1 family [Bacillota bacterium]